MLSINPINSNEIFYNESINQANTNFKSKNQHKLKEASKAFESIFIYQMFKSMNDNIVKSNLIKENQAEKIFKDFLLKQRSENIVDNSSLGIAKSIYEQYSKYVD